MVRLRSVVHRRDFARVRLASCLHFPQTGMRKIIAPVMLLLLAVVHGPTQAQALVSSLFPSVFPLATSEPAMLFLTGLALLSLSSVGRGRTR
jgi:hypothetical protein